MPWIVGTRLSTNAFPQVEAGIEFFSQILLFVCVQKIATLVIDCEIWT